MHCTTNRLMSVCKLINNILQSCECDMIWELTKCTEVYSSCRNNCMDTKTHVQIVCVSVYMVDILFKLFTNSNFLAVEIYHVCALQAHTNVLLAFSLQGSGAFQGLARICAKSSRTLPKVDWTFPPNITPALMSAVFKLDWLSQ